MAEPKTPVDGNTIKHHHSDSQSRGKLSVLGSQIEFAEVISAGNIADKQKVREIKKSELQKKLRKPSNRFVVFRSILNGILKHEEDRKSLKQISKLASAIWSQRTESVEHYFAYLESEEAIYHESMYFALATSEKKTSGESNNIFGDSQEEMDFEKNTAESEHSSEKKDTSASGEFSSTLNARQMIEPGSVVVQSKVIFEPTVSKVSVKRLGGGSVSSRIRFIKPKKEIIKVVQKKKQGRKKKEKGERKSQFISVFSSSFSMVQMEDVFIVKPTNS
ncbi:hypothetical protein CANARDRAFT_10359 [[Candida] arabinofermentans NRRL YB-2248]|uniref:Uncharacterized protein n=1 Tax=[Candida] arabinofermentans NRRL YB-2248 TaxID=983967 RepID=A0A1E4ST67_9ASCO|nr:hypothetical protein CANARDRAFT_10359 [[Candida] arabinofermentans NRRL YB-2248]